MDDLIPALSGFGITNLQQLTSGHILHLLTSIMFVVHKYLAYIVFKQFIEIFSENVT